MPQLIPPLNLSRQAIENNKPAGGWSSGLAGSVGWKRATSDDACARGDLYGVPWLVSPSRCRGPARTAGINGTRLSRVRALSIGFFGAARRGILDSHCGFLRRHDRLLFLPLAQRMNEVVAVWRVEHPQHRLMVDRLHLEQADRKSV